MCNFWHRKLLAESWPKNSFSFPLLSKHARHWISTAARNLLRHDVSKRAEATFSWLQVHFKCRNGYSSCSSSGWKAAAHYCGRKLQCSPQTVLPKCFIMKWHDLSFYNLPYICLESPTFFLNYLSVSFNLLINAPFSSFSSSLNRVTIHMMKQQMQKAL